MSASFLAAAAVRAADARDATEPEVSLSSLPMEIISDILRRTASTRSLALASRVSKAMHAFAAAAALDRASELGYAANFGRHLTTALGVSKITGLTKITDSQAAQSRGSTCSTIALASRGCQNMGFLSKKMGATRSTRCARTLPTSGLACVGSLV